MLGGAATPPPDSVVSGPAEPITKILLQHELISLRLGVERSIKKKKKHSDILIRSDVFSRI